MIDQDIARCARCSGPVHASMDEPCPAAPLPLGHAFYEGSLSEPTFCVWREGSGQEPCGRREAAHQPGASLRQEVDSIAAALVQRGESQALAICHEALADAHAALDPGEHPELCARLNRILDHEAGGACTEYQRALSDAREEGRLAAQLDSAIAARTVPGLGDWRLEAEAEIATLRGGLAEKIVWDRLREAEAEAQLAHNLQGQIDYMCSEIAKATNLEVQTPAGTVQTVREMMDGAERAHHRATEAEAALNAARGSECQPKRRP